MEMIEESCLPVPEEAVFNIFSSDLVQLKTAEQEDKFLYSNSVLIQGTRKTYSSEEHPVSLNKGLGILSDQEVIILFDSRMLSGKPERAQTRSRGRSPRNPSERDWIPRPEAHNQQSNFPAGIGLTMMLKCGYVPGRGLGKELNGIVSPIEAIGSARDKSGLGYEEHDYEMLHDKWPKSGRIIKFIRPDPEEVTKRSTGRS